MNTGVTLVGKVADQSFPLVGPWNPPYNFSPCSVHLGVYAWLLHTRRQYSSLFFTFESFEHWTDCLIYTISKLVPHYQKVSGQSWASKNFYCTCMMHLRNCKWTKYFQVCVSYDSTLHILSNQNCMHIINAYQRRKMLNETQARRQLCSISFWDLVSDSK